MENKKRKEKEDESDEEKKMDKFYSLLRSFREARDRRRRELEELDQKKKKRKAETTSSPPPIWVPSFESGDFTTEVEFRRPPLIFPSPYNPSSTSTSATTSPSNPCDVKHKGNKLQDQHQDDVLGLNLNLAL